MGDGSASPLTRPATHPASGGGGARPLLLLQRRHDGTLPFFLRGLARRAAGRLCGDGEVGTAWSGVGAAARLRRLRLAAAWCALRLSTLASRCQVAVPGNKG